MTAPSFSFEALGTRWAVLVEDGELSGATQEKILTRVTNFEREFSRFIPSSQVCAFKTAVNGTYPVSAELATLLAHSQYLRTITQGAFNPAIGSVLEKAGYNSSYSFTEDVSLATAPQPLAEWSLDGQEVTISGPLLFDFGGIGKGFLIDVVAALVAQAGHAHYLVDGGGDMFATTKNDGKPWQIALEWPGKPETALGVVELSNQGFAASDIFRRAWGEWHHLLNPHSQKPQQEVLGCAATAGSALAADSMTSVLSLCAQELHAPISKELDASFMVLTRGNKASVSRDWRGVFFS